MFKFANCVLRLAEPGIAQTEVVIDLRVIRPELARLKQLLYCFARAAFPAQDHGEAISGISVPWSEFDRVLKCGKSLVKPALGLQGHAEVGESSGVIGA